MKKRLFVIAGGIAVLLVLAAVGMVAWRVHLLQGMNPEGQYFDSNGVRIHYNVAGTGIPVVLVHGLGVNGNVNFGPGGIISTLAKQYRVVTLDLRGHGRSDKPYDPRQYGVQLCEDIIRLMDHLQIEKAHVLGYSMGGFIVLKLASLHPDRLLSFAPCGAGWTREPEKECQFFQELADNLDRGEGYGILSERLTPIGRKVRWHHRFLMNLGLSVMNDEKAIAALLRSMPELVVPEEALRKNTIPALAVVGQRDPLRVFAEEMASITPSMQLVITPEADHMSALDKPVTMEAIEAFLRENSRGKETEALPDAA